MNSKWRQALAFGALTAAAGLAAGGQFTIILPLACAIGIGFLIAETHGWLRALENHAMRDSTVTAAFSLLVFLFVGVTGGSASPLLCALYLPILLSTLYYGLPLGLWTSLGMAVAYGLFVFSGPHLPAAPLGPTLAIAFSYPIMALFGGVLRGQMESRLNDLDHEKQDITAMLDMSQMMEAAIDLDMTLNLILLTVQQHCACRVSAVYLKSADGRALELRASSGPHGKVSLLPAFPLDEARHEIRGVSGLPHEELYEQTSYASEPPSAALILANIDPEAASFACLPLAGVEGLLGMLYVGCTEMNGLTPEAVQRLEQIAAYAAFPLHRVLLQQDFRTLAYSDPMTGLDNFRQFEETLADEMARAERYSRPLSLILLDIDHFKSFNDTLGHPAGDALLGQLGVVLRNCLRNVDRPARYGGEEFVVICPETGAKEAHLIAERIRRSVAETVFALVEKSGGEKVSGEGTTHVTVSLGCATYPADARTSRDLVKKADTALYDAKAAGRNTVRAYAADHRQAQAV